MPFLFEEEIERVKRLPPIGARIVKSAVAVALCMVIYYLRTLSSMSDGLPFYSAISAIWCMQPNYETTKSNAGQRTIGTFIGAVFGFLYIVFVRLVGMQESLPAYLIASLMVIPLIYSTVVMDKKQATFFSCSVFLSISHLLILSMRILRSLYPNTLGEYTNGNSEGISQEVIQVPLEQTTEKVYLVNDADEYVITTPFSLLFGNIYDPINIQQVEITMTDGTTYDVNANHSFDILRYLSTKDCSILSIPFTDSLK